MDMFGVQELWSAASSSAFFAEKSVILASDNPNKLSGRKKFRETRHLLYRGVRLRDSGSELREPNKKTRICLGTYATAEMAATIAFKGRLACLNFAYSTWRLPVPASSSGKDIQKAAEEGAAAANATWMEYLEEEEEAGVLLFGMEEGLILPPPPHYNDDVAFHADTDMPLWSYPL